MCKYLKLVDAALEDGFRVDSQVDEDVLLCIKRILFQTPEGACLAFGTRTHDKQKCAETIMNIGRMWLSPR